MCDYERVGVTMSVCVRVCVLLLYILTDITHVNNSNIHCFTGLGRRVGKSADWWPVLPWETVSPISHSTTLSYNSKIRPCHMPF